MEKLVFFLGRITTETDLTRWSDGWRLKRTTSPSRRCRSTMVPSLSFSARFSLSPYWMWGTCHIETCTAIYGDSKGVCFRKLLALTTIRTRGKTCIWSKLRIFPSPKHNRETVFEALIRAGKKHSKTSYLPWDTAWNPSRGPWCGWRPGAPRCRCARAAASLSGCAPWPIISKENFDFWSISNETYEFWSISNDNFDFWFISNDNFDFWPISNETYDWDTHIELDVTMAYGIGRNEGI